MRKTAVLIFIVFLLAIPVVNSQASEVTISVLFNKDDFNKDDFNQVLRYGCIENTVKENIPTFGLVSAASTRSMIFVEDSNYYQIEITQGKSNKFLFPATWSGCTTISERMRFLSDVLMPYGSFVQYVAQARAMLVYPMTDIVGDLSRSGRFSLLLQKLGGKIVVGTK